MSDITQSSLLQRVQAIMPDFKGKHFERDREVLFNHLLIVNHILDFHFAGDEEYARRLNVLEWTLRGLGENLA